MAVIGLQSNNNDRKTIVKDKIFHIVCNVYNNHLT